MSTREDYLQSEQPPVYPDGFSMSSHATARADGWFEGVVAEYRRRTPGSLAAYEQHKRIIPGGLPAGLGQIRPYPLYVTRAAGARVWDVDGNEYVDVTEADWLLPLGFCQPHVVEATVKQLRDGTTFYSPHPTLGYEFASILQERIPSIEKIRFTTSGTEATQTALRLARGFTGRGKVAKMRGGYHGTHDVSLIANGRNQKTPDYVSPGLIPGTAESTVLLPFNDADRCEQIIEANASELAGVIVEPMLGGSGMVPGSQEFLQRLRDVTTKHGVVLIFDETVTFAVGPNGYQGKVGVRPDLTTLGKAIGGGLPLGAYGGRADIMDLVDPDIDPTTAFRHATTLGGSPVCLAAGMAQVKQMTPELHARLEDLGEYFRSGLRDVARRLELPLQATGLAHMFGLHFTETPVVDFDTAQTSDREVITRVLLNALNQGVFSMFGGNGTLSAPMTTADLDFVISAIENGLREGYGR